MTVYAITVNTSGCRLVVDGKPCDRQAVTRGLCVAHARELVTHGRLEEFALPVPAIDRRKRYELKPTDALQEGVCRVIVNDVACTAAATRRGLCGLHYAGIWQRPDLVLDAFCADATQTTYRLRKGPIAGECRVREGDQDCHDAPHARGLCRRHYRLLRDGRPQDFRLIAERDPAERTWHLRRDPREGRCRVAENLIGCGQAAVRRGLCQHHLNVLRSRPALLDVIALPKDRRHVVYTRKDPVPAVDCVVIENGTACTRPAVTRGLCRRHRKALHASDRYQVADFERPEHAIQLRRKTSDEASDGLCLAVVNDTRCAMPARMHGLCRQHYRLAKGLGQLKAIVAPSTPTAPHVALDKNILMDWADHLVFGDRTQDASVALIRHIQAGILRGSISAAAISATYSRLRYRMARPADEGGLGYHADRAEAEARGHIQRLFTATSRWTIIAVDPATVLHALRDPGQLTFEDAMEWAAYQVARTRPGGPDSFVTRDQDFPEGVHPAEWLSRLARLRQ
jgi:hypothetical protein